MRRPGGMATSSPTSASTPSIRSSQSSFRSTSSTRAGPAALRERHLAERCTEAISSAVAARSRRTCPRGRAAHSLQKVSVERGCRNRPAPLSLLRPTRCGVSVAPSGWWITATSRTMRPTPVKDVRPAGVHRRRSLDRPLRGASSRCDDVSPSHERLRRLPVPVVQLFGPLHPASRLPRRTVPGDRRSGERVRVQTPRSRSRRRAQAACVPGLSLP